MHDLSLTSCVKTFNTASLVNKYKALKEIEGGQRCILTSRDYGVAKNTMFPWNNDIKVRCGGNTDKFQFISASDKMRSSTVENFSLLKANFEQSRLQFRLQTFCESKN